MSGSLQNKLQQFEVTPPPSVWNKIAERLDDELAPGDNAIAAKLNDASVTPPQGVWNKIDAELHDNVEYNIQAKTKVIPLVYKRIAVAAILIGLIALSVFYFSGGDEIKKDQFVNVNPDTASEKPQIVDEKFSTPIKDQTIAAVPVRKKAPEKLQRSFGAIRSNIETIEPASPEEAPLYELNTVSALQPVSVSAPPLRDESGNLILDLAMISNGNDEYITVTGPNGKQTKISSKFLNCLGYINAGAASYEMDAKAIHCTTQFEEWRMRLLSEPTFIPTANNFFDIFELKDLLQEM